MTGAILISKSKDELQLLIDLAKKLGIKTKLLTSEDLEDFGLAQAIKKGRTGKRIDTDKFIQKLRNLLS